MASEGAAPLGAERGCLAPSSPSSPTPQPLTCLIPVRMRKKGRGKHSSARPKVINKSSEESAQQKELRQIAESLSAFLKAFGQRFPLLGERVWPAEGPRARRSEARETPHGAALASKYLHPLELRPRPPKETRW